MLVFFHAIYFILSEWGKPPTPVWLSDVREITSQAVEAILEAEID